jgi:hypothetical protein
MIQFDSLLANTELVGLACRLPTLNYMYRVIQYLVGCSSEHYTALKTFYIYILIYICIFISFCIQLKNPTGPSSTGTEGILEQIMFAEMRMTSAELACGLATMTLLQTTGGHRNKRNVYSRYGKRKTQSYSSHVCQVAYDAASCRTPSQTYF